MKGEPPQARGFRRRVDEPGNEVRPEGEDERTMGPRPVYVDVERSKAELSPESP